jgi:hypothetical protein
MQVSRESRETMGWIEEKERGVNRAQRGEERDGEAGSHPVS